MSIGRIWRLSVDPSSAKGYCWALGELGILFEEWGMTFHEEAAKTCDKRCDHLAMVVVEAGKKRKQRNTVELGDGRLFGEW